MQKRERRKLLAATAGVAAVSYVLGCNPTPTSGNLPAPPPTETVPPTSGNLPAPPPVDASADAGASGDAAAGDAATDAPRD